MPYKMSTVPEDIGTFYSNSRNLFFKKSGGQQEVS